MITICVSTPTPSWPLVLQTQGERGEWGECRFVVDGTCDAADLWVVYEGLPERRRMFCPPGNTLLVTGEPPDVRSYRKGFTDQFGCVLTCQRDLEHPRRILAQQALPWHIGREERNGEDRFVLDFDALASSGIPEKTRLLSVLCSNKTKTSGHRLRLRFVDALREAFGDAVDVFGRGFRPLPCKRDAIFPYRYHVALENCAVPDYWTEKLADAYLGGAYPFYWGCPNLADYFSSEAFTRIDIERPDDAIAAIRRDLDGMRFERARSAILAAKEQVLRRHNFFAVVAALVAEGRFPNAERRPVLLRPERDFSLRGKVERLFMSFIRPDRGA